MARMIPATISPEVKSQAERDIFEWLSELEWGNCIVLHSLGMAEHVDKIFGEIDFVIISDEGVLCVEVKGGVVRRSAGVWEFINRYGRVQEKQEGPYEQAQSNEQSLRKYLLDRLKSKEDPICRCAYASCVMTPDCVMDANDSIDIIPEITFDKRNTKEDLPKYFERSFKYWKDKTMEKHHFSGRHLQDEDKERLVRLLRGDFAFVPAMSLSLQRTDEMLQAVTDEQYAIMRGFSAKRLMVSGAAGTGKTLLAMDQCRKFHAGGFHVLFLCYNRKIAGHVRSIFETEGLEIDVYTLHAFLLERTGLELVSNSKFYIETLPETFIESADELMPEEDRYDAIVIDEGQDLMNSYAMLCLEYLVKGGLKNGRWSFFYDRNQNLFGRYDELDDIYEQLENYGAVIYELSINCRNTRQIATETWSVTNVARADILKTSGEAVGYHMYSDRKEERKEVFKLLKKLFAEGIKRSEVIILSPYRLDNEKNCLYDAKIPPELGTLPLNNYDEPNDEQLRVSTVQAYKGLEAKVVIYTDVKGFKEDDHRMLNYVAMSRARTLLEIFYDKNLEEERLEMMRRGAE